MPEMTLNIILLIVIGLVVVLGVLAMFWGTLSKFLPWVKGPTINSATISAVRAQCVLKCSQEKSVIVANPATWTLSYDLNGDGISDTVNCGNGAITWGVGTPADVTPITRIESTAWAYTCS